MNLTLFPFVLTCSRSHRHLPLQKCTPHQRAMRLTRLPSLLEFFSYVYFFGGFLAGPAFNMKEYLDFMNGTLFASVRVLLASVFFLFLFCFFLCLLRFSFF